MTGDDTASGLAILWDVDGPLNPYAAKPHLRPEGYTTHRLRPEGFEDRVVDGRRIKPLRVWLNPEHGPKMLALARELGGENWWATTWGDDANRMIGPVLGLPPMPSVFGGGVYIGVGWKWPAVRSLFAERPLAWLDDDFHHRWNQDERDRFLAHRTGVPTLLHHVDPQRGLTDEDFDAVRVWTASWEKTVSR